jgi:hypothetical protein
MAETVSINGRRHHLLDEADSERVIARDGGSTD